MSELVYGNEYNQSHALIVGIDYKEETNFPELDATIKDAEAIEELLKSLFKFDNVYLLINQDASEKNIKKYLRNVFPITDKNDRILIYFAGHGVTRPKAAGGMAGYIIPYGVQKNQWDGYIEMIDDLVKESEVFPAKHTLFILDACYSGLALSDKKYRSGEIEVDKFVSDLKSRRTVQVITAGGNERVLDKWHDGHSLFTGKLIEVLNKAQGGLLTASDLGRELKEVVYREAGQKPQYGVFPEQDLGGDFVLFEDPQIKLPDDLTLAMESPYPGVRKAIVPELGKIIKNRIYDAQVNLAWDSLFSLSKDQDGGVRDVVTGELLALKSKGVGIPEQLNQLIEEKKSTEPRRERAIVRDFEKFQTLGFDNTTSDIPNISGSWKGYYNQDEVNYQFSLFLTVDDHMIIEGTAREPKPDWYAKEQQMLQYPINLVPGYTLESAISGEVNYEAKAVKFTKSYYYRSTPQYQNALQNAHYPTLPPLIYEGTIKNDETNKSMVITGFWHFDDPNKSIDMEIHGTFRLERDI